MRVDGRRFTLLRPMRNGGDDRGEARSGSALLGGGEKRRVSKLETLQAEVVALERNGGQPDAEPRPPLEVLTAKAVCELPEPPAEDELLGPLVVRGGRLVLGGQTGEGKTTLGLQIIAAIATGSELLGWAGREGRVLVIDAEQGLRTIKRRLREAGSTNPSGSTSYAPRTGCGSTPTMASTPSLRSCSPPANTPPCLPTRSTSSTPATPTMSARPST